MEIKIKDNKKFQPVTIEWTFETERELQGAIQFFGNFTAHDLEEKINSEDIASNGRVLIKDFNTVRDANFCSRLYTALIKQ